VEIRTCDAQEVFELPNYHGQDLPLHALVEIRKKSAIEEAEEPAPDLEPDPDERAVTALKLTRGLGPTEAGSEVCAGIDWKEM
jgi:hypothetical protein